MTIENAAPKDGETSLRCGIFFALTTRGLRPAIDASCDIHHFNRRSCTLTTKGMSRQQSPSHLVAILQALFVTFLWSTSFVLIKIGLRGNLPPVTFAGLRYTAAFLCLVPFALLHAESRNILRRLTRTEWKFLLLLGLAMYTVAQSAQFISLKYVPSATFSLMLNLMPAVVALAGIALLNERPTVIQWSGLGLSLVGVGLYFFPAHFMAGQAIGVVAAVVGMLASAAASLLGRHVNRQSHLPPLVVTFVSMGIGSVLLLGAGVATQGIGPVTSQQALIIIWLAVVNTAVGFTLWNHTLQTLTATESSIINCLMLPQTAVLSFLFLGEPLTAKQIVGLVLVGAGAIVVQVRRGASRRQLGVP